MQTNASLDQRHNSSSLWDCIKLQIEELQKGVTDMTIAELQENE